MPSVALPNRRECETRDVVFDGHRFTVSIDRHPDGRPGEVRVSGAKEGSALQALSVDAGILISGLLQHDVPLDAISLSRVPRWHDGREVESPASLLGVIVDVLRETA